jgi:inositol-phosphate phosphatase/L-galactose 1-phosphate phosphatase/histidinol-phosphatase
MTSDLKNSEELLAFAELLADAARVLVREANATPTEIIYKSDGSPVTDLDRRIEERMRSLIDDHYPQHGIHGEEFPSRDLDAELVWVLDPIDGTAPFLAGIPVYGTLIGLAHHGKPFLGVIEHPATDDRWVGITGQFARHNGNAVQVRSCDHLANAFMTNSNPNFLSPTQLSAFTALRSQVRYSIYGASCYAYAMLASGRNDLAVDAGFDAFDVFATIAVIEGAGGIVSDWSGQAIDLNWSGEVIAAGCDVIHNQALEVLADN